MTSHDYLYGSYIEQACLTQLLRWFGLGTDPDGWPERSQESLFSEGAEMLVNGVSEHATRSSLRDGAYQPRPLVGCALPQNLKFEPELSIGTSALCWFSMRVVLDGVISDVDFQIEFASVGSELLPLIRSVELLNLKQRDLPDDTSNPDFLGCQVLSVSHRWHALVESPDRQLQPFLEIITPDFKMEFGHGAVRSHQELDAWLKGSASSVLAPRHDLESYRCELTEQGRCKAEFVLDWQGLSQERKRMEAKTKHHWTLELGEGRFPRIQHIEVEFIKPFSMLD